MEAVKEASFNSSVVTTLPAWRTFVERSPEPAVLLSDEELRRLTPAERLAYDDERGDYHAELPALSTPTLTRTVTKGLLFMRLNRGHQTGTPCGLILSGVPGVGKTTAVKALGRTVEQAYRKRNPHMTSAVPVVYITMPTAQHPKALPASLTISTPTRSPAASGKPNASAAFTKMNSNHKSVPYAGTTPSWRPYPTTSGTEPQQERAWSAPTIAAMTPPTRKTSTRSGALAGSSWLPGSPIAGSPGNDVLDGTGCFAIVPSSCRFPGSGRRDDWHGTVVVPCHGRCRISLIPPGAMTAHTTRT